MMSGISKDFMFEVRVPKTAIKVEHHFYNQDR
jgi:hypothetical protein